MCAIDGMGTAGDHGPVNERDLARLTHAVDRFNESGDPEPFVGLMSADMTWSGVPRAGSGADSLRVDADPTRPVRSSFISWNA